LTLCLFITLIFFLCRAEIVVITSMEREVKVSESESDFMW